jgi:hypothetical protein
MEYTMAKIFNFTPHKLTIVEEPYLYDKSIRKYTTTLENLSIASEIESSGVLSANVGTVPGSPVNGIPTFVKKVTGCDPIPDEVGEDDIIVVSALYASAYRQLHGDDSRLYTVADPVYNADDPRMILGSRGICPAF